MTPSIVALIPARAGSKRCPSKNTRLLAGKPLIAYTIEAAQESGIFSGVAVSSDDPKALDIARRLGVSAYDRPSEFATDDSPDIDWVRHALSLTAAPEAFAIMRPTSPFRTADVIRLAWDDFLASQPCDSLRAIEPVTEHPGKMWIFENGLPGFGIVPLLPETLRGVPWHSCPTQTLPIVYRQNASLEIAWTRVVRDTGTISGTHIMPFFYPTLDINTEDDWKEAERLMAKQPVEYLG